jgi:D-xylose transport system substrate-binding protein
VSNGLETKVGVILPDRSSRWRTSELTALQAACAAAHLDCLFKNAGGSATAMATIADQLVTIGVRMLVLVPISAASAATIERDARRNGVLTVEYDQHVPNGSAAAFVRPDTVATGRLLGAGLTHCPQIAPGPVPYARIDAPANRVGALAQRDAYERVLDHAPGWSVAATGTAGDAGSARTAAASILRNFSGVQAVLATSDSTAAGVITALTAQHRAGRVAVSGNGATVQGLQHVLAGTQCFTIYHPPAAGAKAVAATLVRLAHFQSVTTRRSVAAAGGRRTPVVEYGGAQLVTRNRVKAIVATGYADRAAVCTARYAAACIAAGI